MDIKELNKHQLVLLTLLLNFVVSIATGITTVTLMQQAPISITQPINHIIQQTIEKVVPAEIGKPAVQTVIVKEEDLVVGAISKNQSSIFSITKEVLDETEQIIEVSAGRGFVVSKEGVLVADAISVPDKGTYFVKNSSGKFKAEFISTDKAGFSFLKIGEPVDDKSKLSFGVPSFEDVEKMKVGQKLIILGQSISSIIFDGSKDVRITISSTNSGSPVVNLDGNVIGMALYGDTSFVPVTLINTVLNPAPVSDVPTTALNTLPIPNKPIQ